MLKANGITASSVFAEYAAKESPSFSLKKSEKGLPRIWFKGLLKSVAQFSLQY
jgi:hypothetical protein